MEHTTGQQFFWVNHKQTFRIARRDGFIWAPCRAKDNKPRASYESLKLAKDGDIIFSYAYGKIGAVGVITSNCHDAVQPPDFDSFWDNQGWKVDVDFKILSEPLVPKLHLEQIVPLLPTVHSPIKPNGNGNETYLSKISPALGKLLLSLTNTQNLVSAQGIRGFNELKDDLAEIESSSKIEPTEKERLYQARIGQGKFRRDVLKLYPACPVTGLEMPELLRASHIKPWRECSDKERLDPYNGIMLAPHIDALFDQGFISFTDEGQLMISQRVDVRESIKKMKLSIDINIKIYAQARGYLALHRQKV
ncbi:HNH endonuclease [Budvicia aquatica]|uniref:HNH endonuclease n=1 Tax=Budvicia aquatica TaxID=82979 RepID=UPI00208179EB|nr:HNH endonuclease [Budvicia aquatica]GKX50591.1 HNH endonuclease [Budvicia aquatica]